MATKWLSEDEQRAWRAFIETHGDLTHALEHDLTEHGLTLGDYQVLVYLTEAEDSQMRMCDLADVLQLSPSGLTRRLDGLVSDGHVERLRSPSDGRVMLAALTESGRALLTETAPHHVASVRRVIFDHLTPDEVAAMESIFTKVAQAIAEQTDESDPDSSSAA